MYMHEEWTQGTDFVKCDFVIKSIVKTQQAQKT